MKKMFRIKIGVTHIKDGVRQPEKIIPANSWVKNMGGALAHIFVPSDVTFPSKSNRGPGQDGFFQTGATFLYMDLSAAILGIDFLGILAGTDSTAPTRDDFEMGTLISHGVGAGQLTYNAHSIGAVQAVAGGYLITNSRQFDNGSGGSITIEEIGMVVNANLTTGFNDILILHDLLPGGELVLNGASLIVSYHWEFLV